VNTTAHARGRRVAARRDALGLTQEQLAQLCECSVRTLTRIESGESDSMTERLIEALHRHLRMPFEELLDGKGTK
jgi:transcriptional regulator with XRE-family HTH domain